MLVPLSIALVLAPRPVEIKLVVDGKERTALVVAPSKISKPAPVIFAYHGHGGNQRYSVQKFKFQETWPEVVCVYPQGLPAKTPNDPQGLRNGWESTHNNSNRDVKFFDALYKEIIKRYSVNQKQVFVMGHSNGATMTYALWATRGDKIAAVGPCAAPGVRGITVPKPAFVELGEKDPIVNVPLQRWNLNQVKQLNGVTGQGKSLGSYLLDFKGTVPMQTYVHPGGHELPSEVIPMMAKFFRSIAQSQK